VVAAQGDEVVVRVKLDDFAFDQMTPRAGLQLVKQAGVATGAVPECWPRRYTSNQSVIINQK